MKGNKVSKFAKRVLSVLLMVVMLTTQFAGTTPPAVTESDEYVESSASEGGNENAAQTISENNAVAEKTMPEPETMESGSESPAEAEPVETEPETAESEPEQPAETATVETESATELKTASAAPEEAETESVSEEAEAEPAEALLKADVLAADEWSGSISELGIEGFAVPAISGDTATFADLELDWVAQNAGGIERPADGWWVGVRITAPAEVTAENIGGVKFTINSGEEQDFGNDDVVDGRYVLYLWCLVTPEKLTSGEGLSWTVAVTWAEGHTQSFTVNANRENVTLNKDGALWFQTVDGSVEVDEGKCTITFDYNDGGVTANTESKVTPGDPVTAPTAPPREDGYIFGGWYNGNDLYNFETSVTESFTLAARWEGTLTLKANYDGGTDGTLTVNYNKEMPDAGMPAERKGYKFAGYYTAASDGEQVFDADGKAADGYKTCTLTGATDMTLYAHWTLNTDNFQIKAGNDGTIAYLWSDKSSKYEIEGWTNAESITVEGVNGATVNYTVESVPSPEAGAAKTYDVTFALSDDDANTADTGEITLTIRSDRDAPVVSETFDDGNTEDEENHIALVDGVYRSSDGFTITLSVSNTTEAAQSDFDYTSAVVKLYEKTSGGEFVESDMVIGAVDWTYPVIALNSTSLTEKAEYFIAVTGVKDRAGNIAEDYTSTHFVFDQEDPSVLVALPDGAYDSKYYADTVTATLRVRDSFLTDTTVNGAATITLKKNDVEEPVTKAFSPAVDKESGDTIPNTWEMQLALAKDDNATNIYTIEIKVSDETTRDLDKMTGTSTAVIDATKPVIDDDNTVIPENVGDKANSRELKVAFADDTNGSGVAKTYYYIESADENEYPLDKVTVGGTAYTTLEKNGADIDGDGEPDFTGVVYDNGTLTIETIGAEFRGAISFCAVDNVGNWSAVSSYALNIDNLGPLVTIEDPALEDVTGSAITDEEARYSSKLETYIITVTDDNLTDSEESPVENKITVQVYCGEIDITSETGRYTYDETAWGKNSEGAWENTVMILAPADHGNDGQYHIVVTARDDLGISTIPEGETEARSQKTSGTLVIDTTPVEVEVIEFAMVDGVEMKPSNPNEIGGTYYSSTDVVYTLRVEDANIQLTPDGKQPLQAEGILDVYLTTDGTRTKILPGDTEAYTLTNWTPVPAGTAPAEATVWEATLTIKAIDTEKSTYGVELAATDKARTAANSDRSTPLVIDTTPVSVTVSAPKNVSGNGGSVYGDTDAYYSKTAVVYELTLEDENIKLTEGGTQPVAEIWLKEDNGDFAKISVADTDYYTFSGWRSEGDALTATKWTAMLTINAPADTPKKAFVVKVNATDKTSYKTDDVADQNEGSAEHVSKQTKPLVIDTIAPAVSISTPDECTNSSDASGTLTYYSNQNVTYTLTVSDPDFVSMNELGKDSITGQTAAEVKVNGDVVTPGASGENDPYMLSEWSFNSESGEATATLVFNASEEIPRKEYTIILSAVDRAANATDDNGIANQDDSTAPYATKESWPLVMDTTAPEITIAEPVGYTGKDSSNNFYTNKTDGSMTVEIRVTDDSLIYKNGEFILGGITVTVLEAGTTQAADKDYYSFNDKAWKQNGNHYTNTVTFSAADNEEIELDILVEAWDGTAKTFNADKGNKSSKNADENFYGKGRIILDAIVPSLDFTGYTANQSYNGDYYSDAAAAVASGDMWNVYRFVGKSDLYVTVQVDDSHIDFNDMRIKAGKASETDYTITVFQYETLEDAKAGGSTDVMTEGREYTLGGWEGGPTRWTNLVTITRDAPEGYYVIQASADDKATNQNVYNTNGSDGDGKESGLVNDTTPPRIVENRTNVTESRTYGDGRTVHYSTPSLTNNAALTATFTVTDNNHLDINGTDIDVTRASVTILKYDETSGRSAEVLAESTSGQSIISAWSGDDASGYTTSVTLGDLTDGIYTVKIVVSDMAGNQTTYESNYYVVDKTKPTGTIASSGSGFSGSRWDAFLNAITFGLYSKNGISTTMTWDDNADSFLNDREGVDTVQYWVYVVNSATSTGQPFANESEVNDTATWTNISAVSADTFSFNTANDTKFIVYLKMTDIAGNWRIISSDGLITEDDPSQINSDTTNPEILVTVANQNGGYSGIHDSSVSLGVLVIEYPDQIFSGIKNVSYTIADGYGGSVDLSRGGMSYGTIIDRNNGRGDESVVISVPSGYESDQIRFTATAVDNADNSKTVTYTDLNIDNHTPEATITYDNNTAYNSRYFNQPRTATIVVREMNFDSSNTSVNTAGSVSGWSTSGSGSNTTNTATARYAADGDYTISFQTTDKAGHTLTDSGVTYNGTAAQAFTIDMTKPTATITFQDANGNAVPSGGYANSTVTATITIVEHNFDESSATRGITITRDGEPHTENISWLHNGDTHTATISFIEEEGAYYTFDMSFVDLANNECDPFEQVSFYVDTMQPEVVVTNIAHRSANNARTIAPVITVTDKYYDRDHVTITLTGAKKGVISSPGITITDVENGQQFAFANIEDDDIYTVTVVATDLALNVINTMYVELSDDTTDALVFSVNREGSTYSVDGTTKALLVGYYTNGLAEDIVITVINVDEIEGFVITTSRGLIDSRDLAGDEDYTIEKEAIIGGYQYTITISKEVFDRDGAYAISVYTEDKAGNTSTNVTADEEHGLDIEFYLDTEAPSIVLNNLDKGATYVFDSYDGGSVVVSDQTLDEVTVEISYADGSTLTYIWGPEEIGTTDFNGTYTARLDGAKAIAQSSSLRGINIRVAARDKAGNVTEGPYSETSDGIVLDENYSFYVTTNALTRFYANKGLFYGTIGGVVVLGAGGTGLVLGRRRKKEKATV